jgi:histidinol-phosphate aminotransferase
MISPKSSSGKTMFDPQELIRRHLDELPPYTPIEPFEVLSAKLGRMPAEIIKMDANENPYGPSPRARQALADLTFPHIYPDPESRALRNAISEFTGVPDINLLAGAGADELIDLLLRVFVEPGDVVLSCPPTFGMYSFDTRLNAGNLVEIPRMADFSIEVMAIRNIVGMYHPKILLLASPNNPDGSTIAPDVFDEILDLPVFVILDEAYIEFTKDGLLGDKATRIRHILNHENLAVLRTFSKWAGLAGLRIGYGAFPDWLMPILQKTKQPYNINVAASTAAIASLQDVDYLQEIVSRLCAERDRLFAELTHFSWLDPYPSSSNFILCRVEGVPAIQLKSLLAERYGIFVRYFNTPRLLDHIRISVGTPVMTEMLLKALKEIKL